MELYEITIWKWQEVLHKGVYEFETSKDASLYELGIFDGLRIAGKNPTGTSCKKQE